MTAASRIRFRRALAAAAMAALLACSPAPKAEAPKKAAEPPKPLTGLSAIYRMFQLARTWAPDALPLTAQSHNLDAVKSEGGKAGAWSVTFVSQSRGKSRLYTWAAVEGEGFKEGVFSQQEATWMGPTGQALPFRMEALKKDSVAAWEVAAAKSEAFMKRNPGTPVFFVAEYTSRFPNPSWRVVWGESISRSGYSIFVDTVTGQYLQTGR
jgi:hypothetical protein